MTRWLVLFACALGCAGQEHPQVAGVTAVPHVTAEETRYRGRSTPEGAWVQIILHNPTAVPLPMPTLVNGREPFQWVLAGEWSWTDATRTIPAGGYGVLSFNAVTSRWRPGAEIVLESVRRPFRIALRLPETGPSLAKIAFLPARRTVVVHHRNAPGAAVQLVRLKLHTGAGFLRTLELQPAFRTPPTSDAERDVSLWVAEELPAGQALVEAHLSNNLKLWSLLKVKDDSFDIGAGWLDTRAPNGTNPLTVPLFRSLLRRLHINLIHSQNDPAPDARPFRRMSTFADVARFSLPAEAATIHCADVVGEPQHSALAPWEVFRRLKPYEPAAYPTCLTLSEDLGFGFYAGLSDWPHFDAYRVNAPHADDWTAYRRFGEPLTWGAPLETVGAMMRVLNAVSRPRPVAAWSQSAHYNWRTPMGGRARLDPTPGEMAMQAWQAIANGAQSLYWYSLESYSALRSPDLLAPTMHIGRQLRVLQELLETGDAIWHKRLEKVDLNTIAAPEAAILFALDLDYRPDPESKTFQWPGLRTIEAEFELPPWLRGAPLQVLRFTPDAFSAVPAEATTQGVRLRAELDVTAIYIAFKNNSLPEQLKRKLETTRAAEAAESFDPANPGHLGQLAEALGYARILR